MGRLRRPCLTRGSGCGGRRKRPIPAAASSPAPTVTNFSQKLVMRRIYMADIMPYLETIREHFAQSDIRASLKDRAKTLQFVFTDLQRNYTLHVDAEGNMSIAEQTVPKPDVTVTTTSDILADLIDGKMNPINAFFTRKLKIGGNMEDILLLQKLL
jgi:putative sterol carrier protein